MNNKNTYEYQNQISEIPEIESSDNLKEIIYNLITKKNYHQLQNILKKKINIEKNIFNGNNILHSSIKDEKKEITNFLLNFNFQKDALNRRGKGYIHLASKKGDIFLVKNLLSKNIFVDQLCGNDKTALYYSFKKNNFDLVYFLLENKADIDFIWLAIFEDLICYDFVNGDIILFLKNILRNKQIFFVDFHLNTPVKFVFEEGIIKLVYSEDITHTILYYSLFLKNYHLFKKIIDSGADIFRRDENGFDIFFSACLISCNPIIKLLLTKNFDINRKVENLLPIEIVAKLKNYKIFEILLKQNPEIISKNKNLNLVHSIILLNDKKLIKILINYIKDLNHRDTHGNSYLHFIAAHGLVKIFRIFIKKGLNYNLVNKEGNPPIFLALLNSHFEMVKFLIDLKCDLKIVNFYGDNCMNFAFISDKVQIVDLLVKGGFDPFLKNQRSQTFLHYLVKIGKKKFFDLFLGYGVDINSVDRSGLAAIHYAVILKKYDILDLLLNKGAVLNIFDEFKWNPNQYNKWFNCLYKI